MKFPISHWLPTGMVQFAQLANVPGNWGALWLRWLSWRAQDSAFAAFLDDLENWLTNQPPTDWQTRLTQHLATFRNRYFLFLLWSNACSENLHAEAQLPPIDWLSPRDQAALWRWYRQVQIDEAAHATLKNLPQCQPLCDALNFRGVSLIDAFDYYLLPEWLLRHYRAFEANNHSEPSSSIATEIATGTTT